jgi:hypothetical protein
MPDLTPQWFWDEYRRRLRRSVTTAILNEELPRWKNEYPSSTWAKKAAYDVCRTLGEKVIVKADLPGVTGGEATVTWEDPPGTIQSGRSDVAASLPGRSRFLISYEHEGAAVGYKGKKNNKNWREEFVKLCGVDADLKVLSSYFLSKTGSGFLDFLRRELETMRQHFRPEDGAKWLLIYGPDYSSKDPTQPWLAYELKPDFTLARLLDGSGDRFPFRPRLVAEGKDSQQEE